MAIKMDLILKGASALASLIQALLEIIKIPAIKVFIEAWFDKPDSEKIRDINKVEAFVKRTEQDDNEEGA